MTPEDVMSELHQREAKAELANLRADIYKDFGNFRSDLIKAIWLTQFSTIVVIVVAAGLLLVSKSKREKN
jgi:hypothetical protein